MGHNKASDRRKVKRKRFLKESLRLKRKLWLHNFLLAQFQKRFEKVQ